MNKTQWPGGFISHGVTMSVSWLDLEYQFGDEGGAMAYN